MDLAFWLKMLTALILLVTAAISWFGASILLRRNRKAKENGPVEGEDRARKNTEAILLQSQDVLRRLGMEEWWNNPDEGVMTLNEWLLLIPIIDRLLARVEELESKQVVGYTYTQTLPKH